MRKKTWRTMLLSLLLALACGLGIALAGCGEVEKQPSTYTVTFETHGGTALDPVQWTEGTTLTVETPKKARYTFAGWYYDDPPTEEADLSALHAEGDFTLYAKWDYVPQTYPVTFETHGGSGVSQTTWTEGEALGAQPPARNGYTFAGWYFDADYEKEADPSELAVQPEGTAALTLHAKWEANEYTVTIYPDHDGAGEPAVKKYKTDETVDPSEWETPALLYEGESISFLYWEPETGEGVYKQDETFTMPAKNLALYPVFDMPQLFNWAYDPAAQTYTSTGGGIRPAKGSEGAYYGTVSADFEVPADSTVTGLGLFWNATYPDDDNPYNGTGVSYHYMHLNPQSGGFQYARVDGDAETSYANTNFAKTLAPTWSAKWEAWDTARKADEGTPLTFTLKVEFTPTGMTLYIDSEKLGTYAGEYLNALTGKLAGIRAGGKGIVAKNVTVKASSDYPDSVVHVLSYETDIPSVSLPDMLWAEGAPIDGSLPLGVYNGYEFKWFTDATHDSPVSGNSLSSYVLYGVGTQVELKNGYKVYADKYVVNGSPSTPVIITLPEIQGETGQLSATFTATKETGKIGLFFLGSVPGAEENVYWNDKEVDGYSLYLNIGAIVDRPNAYFTLGHIVGGKYDASKNTQAEFGPYNYSSAKAGHGEYTKLYNEIYAVREGSEESVTFRMTLTVTATRIVFALNGSVLFVRENPNTKEGAAVHHDGTGWGFYASGAGTWSEIEFNGEVREKNGFLITKDGAGKDVYTSAPLSATASVATLAEGLGGQYGKFEATATVSNLQNGRIGLLMNASLTDAADGGDLVWSDQSVNGFFLYHNFAANANFTIASITEGSYTSGGAKAYAASGAVNESAPQQLKDYHAKVAALLGDTVSSVTVKLAVEVTKEHVINVYVDDLLYITNTAYYATKPDLASLTGVGFVAYGPGTVFSDITFVPASE